ncbi:hypothetical protein LCGC14_1377240 [marine sediment metagenome]|uniref:ParB-like N-terminal domain-containing protein n=1 Tax=marine sediment metagenome TaxID=412755 RepID=A0A0F9K3P8_9ZZZZ
MNKILQIGQVELDKETYPRLVVDWVTSARYYNALRSGAVFPPIVVAQIDKKYYLVDGMHRLKAHQGNKETHIQCEVLKGLDKKQIFLEAVKRNITHGRQFSTQEVTGICITLDNWKMSQEEISEIVRIPALEIKPFVAKRMTRTMQGTEDIPLKASVKNLAGIIVEKLDQKSLTGSTQVRLIDSLCVLIKEDWIDKGNETILKKLNKLYQLLEPYKIVKVVRIKKK